MALEHDHVTRDINSFSSLPSPYLCTPFILPHGNSSPLDRSHFLLFDGLELGNPVHGLDILGLELQIGRKSTKGTLAK
jgi:hypothetical protein